MRIITLGPGKGKNHKNYEVFFQLEGQEVHDDFDELGQRKVFVHGDLVYRFDLKEDLVLAMDRYEEMLRLNEEMLAKEKALSMLDYRMRTKKEIEKKLQELGTSTGTIDKTLENLENYGFVDDELYASRYAKERVRQRGLRVIRHELSQKGIESEDTRELFEELKSEEEEAALLAAKRKLRNLLGRNLEKNKVKEKLYRFLLSRGYDYDLVKKSSQLAFDEIEENPSLME